MPQLIMLVGCPGAGKTTYCMTHYNDYVRISQDEQGLGGHKILFQSALAEGRDIVVDRQNHIKLQRQQYLSAAKAQGYRTKIIWFKVDRDLCEKRVLDRDSHPSIDHTSDVHGIVKAYELNLDKPSKHEADELEEIDVPFYATIQDLSHLEGRIGVFGDLHGVWNETYLAIEKLKLDHYVFLGDLNDRGPDLLKILAFVRSHPNVYVLEGNHENKLKRWLRGNKVTISHGLHISITQLEHLTTEQKMELYRWMQSLPTIIQLPLGYIGVHAGFDLTKPLTQQKYATCIWVRHHGKKFDDPSKPHWFEIEQHSDFKKRTILFGHTVLDQIYVAPNIRALDGGAVYGKELRVCVIDTHTSTEEIHSFPCVKYYDKTSAKANDFFAKREALVEQGYLSRSEKEGLVLYNYTERCTFERAWNKLTLRSRGTIYNKATGELVAKTFDKFFNLNELDATSFDNLPHDLPYQVFEKKDGSLGILYRSQDKWYVATRGSFYSEQAQRATGMLQKYDMSRIPTNVSLSFEIIYPENRIVVPYGNREELVVLAAFDNDTGEELSWKKTCKLAQQAGFSVAETHNYTLDQLVEMAKSLPSTQEGWVVRFDNGLRVKIKGAEYLRIAKILAHVSPLSVWEAMLNGNIDTYLQQIPEEIRSDVEKMRDTLQSQHDNIKHFILQEVERLNLHTFPRLNTLAKNERTATAKQVALIIQQHVSPQLHGLFYQWINNNDISNDIYKKLLRPTDNKFVDIASIVKG